MNDWYAPGEIRFQPEHVEWAINNLNILAAGRWPPNPRVTGYTDIPAPKRGHRSYAEEPICLVAEVTWRLEQCGTDGILARRCLADGWDEQSLADIMHVDPDRIMARVRRVIMYCSGWRRRRIRFAEFKRRAGIRAHYQKVSRE